jgi:hypothetical protein
MSEPFALFDCSLARQATGRVCFNLREMLEAVRTVPDTVLEHHLLHCTLEDYFELYEFPNDLARWCWEGLGDNILAEQLGLVDPYRYASIAELRLAIINLIEDRLWGLERAPWCRAGRELYLMSSRLIAYDTGERFPTPAALAEAIERIPLRSLYYHVYEARRRTSGRIDDFSAWLERYGASPTLVTRLQAIDFYFLNLTQLRQELLQAFRQYLPESTTVTKGAI